MLQRYLFSFTCAALFVSGFAFPAPAARPWPTRWVRLVLPFPPGGPTLIHSRLLAVKPADPPGQQVVSSTIAEAQAASSHPRSLSNTALDEHAATSARRFSPRERDKWAKVIKAAGIKAE